MKFVFAPLIALLSLTATAQAGEVPKEKFAFPVLLGLTHPESSMVFNFEFLDSGRIAEPKEFFAHLTLRIQYAERSNSSKTKTLVIPLREKISLGMSTPGAIRPLDIFTEVRAKEISFSMERKKALKDAIIHDMALELVLYSKKTFGVIPRGVMILVSQEILKNFLSLSLDKLALEISDDEEFKTLLNENNQSTHEPSFGRLIFTVKIFNPSNVQPENKIKPEPGSTPRPSKNSKKVPMA